MSQQETKGMAKHFYRASAADFIKIPGSPVAYWINEKARSVFKNLPSISEEIDVTGGMTTADNERFLRQWHEVGLSKVNFSARSREEAIHSQKKWFPYNKGGSYRKWFGNREYVVNWENDGQEIIDTGRAFPRSKSYYFCESLTYTATSSSYFGIRYSDPGFIFDAKGSSCFAERSVLLTGLGFLASKIASYLLQSINPTIEFQTGNVSILPFDSSIKAEATVSRLIELSRNDWDSYETSWDFTQNPLIVGRPQGATLRSSFQELRDDWRRLTSDVSSLEEHNNRLFIEAYGLSKEINSEVELDETTLTCNPHYRYGGNRSDEELESLLQYDTLGELVSYAIGCMMGRYSLDRPGLILASQGETRQDYLEQIPTPKFAPDENAILPLTDQEWFPDDATNRFREFVRTVWGEEHLQENLDFVAESLCLHAIKAKRGESALDTIRRYLSTQFYKDHLRTYKKRPIYWLFSSGKQKAFECLVYLHRYNESTLARMRTEYVIPLSAKLNAYADKLEQDIEASTSTAETKRLEKEVATLHKQQTELAEFDEKLRHYADQRISLDLDDGVKVNYGKFGDLLAEVKAVHGKSPENI